MTRLVQLVIAATLLVQPALLVYGFMRRQHGRRSDVDPLYPRTLFVYFAGMLITSALIAILYLLPVSMAATDSILNRGLILIVALMVLMGLFGALVLHDLLEEVRLRLIRQRWNFRWVALCTVWLAVFVITTLIMRSALITQPQWLTLLNRGLDLPTIIALAGFTVSGVALLVTGFRLFYQSPLPELANRALYWVLVTALMIVSIVLLGSGSDRFAAVGMLALTLTNLSTVYALTNHRVFDLRGELSRSFSLIGLTLVSAVLLFGALYLATGFELELDTATAEQGVALLAVIAIVIALLYVLIRQVLDVILRRTIDPPVLDPSIVAREFSQRISQVANMSELSKTATTALNDAMKLRRSGLLLVNSTSDEQLELLLISEGTPGAGSDPKDRIVAIPLKSKLYEALASEHRAVAYYDLIYSPLFDPLPDNTRVFFDKVQMSAFAPIVMNELMMGLLVGGPKRNDTAYTENDLNLMTTLAQQTGLALRNARLVADLQHLNATMRSLNRGLEDANQELARLDAVKTDFVTIASHELRTPLAQIRGYTDIIDAVNADGMLEQEQTAMLVNNLRKATERMEELIAAMLDVSQLDVKAMDLRFTQTSVDTLLRLAIEPLTDAIKQRKQSLMVRGVRGLPTIQADLQRMVQAFRNVIVNAIKFTPDGGRIDITAALQPSQTPGGVDHVLITIVDNGVGIDKAHLELIFKKFYRTYDPQLHSSGNYKFLGAGPGLGLTIAKGVIESHGGRIWAESTHHDIKNPPGSTFYILLPTVPPEGTRKSVTFETDLANMKVPTQTS